MGALRNGGRNKAYQHRFDVNYTVPTAQIPYLDFVKVTAQYAGSYNWNAGALNLQDSLGNVISNGQQRQVRADINFETLYRKFKYFEKVQAAPRAKAERGRGSTPGRDTPLPNDPQAPDEAIGDIDPEAERQARREKRRARELSAGERGGRASITPVAARQPHLQRGVRYYPTGLPPAGEVPRVEFRVSRSRGGAS